ncbi:MAG: diacylglycerol kinase family lipid kinase [Bacteroidetes bacterium]|nr:diacylglycerol kinase family lipid kinase [Bacteroidota bacterium]MDA0875296.1 diacylglycerol kinase family lipid kinase [Bacteroidota bacterium]
MSSFKHVLAILNPVSRRGRNRNRIPEIVAGIRQYFPEARVHMTEASGHATQLVTELGGEADLVLACGGDGTVHEVAKGMVHHGIRAPMGVLGLGSGNDFARALRMPTAWSDALEAISAGRIIASDAGTVEWKEEGRTQSGFFINALGVGFDAHTAVLAPRYKGYPLGYTMAILAGLKSWISGGATIRTEGRDGEVIFNGRLMFVSIGNAFDSGGGYTVNPGALISDGQLDPCIVEDISVLRAVALLPKVRFGGHIGMKEVTYLRTAALHIDTDRGLPVHADGEILSLQARDLDVSVLPQALKVVVAPNAPDPV